jgi:TRAP-type transport system periplasmic protein
MKIKKLFIFTIAILVIVLLVSTITSGCSNPPATTSTTTQTTTSSSVTTQTSTATPSSTSTAQKVYTMSIQLAHQRTQFLVQQVFVPFTQTIEARSGGRIKVNLYDQGSVAPNAGVTAALAANTLQASWVLPAWEPGRFPLTDLFSLPMEFPGATVSGLTVQHMYEKFPELAKEWPATLKIMSANTTGLLQIVTSNKQVKTADDLKGLKIFGIDPVSTKYIPFLGANAVSIAMVGASDFYLAIQRNMGDGIVFSLAAVKSSKLNEVTKYCLISNTSQSPFFFIVSKAFYDSLPADLQKILDEETGAKLAEATGKVGLDQAAESDAKWLADNGMTFSKLSSDEIAKWKTLLSPIKAELITQLAGKGYTTQTLQSMLDEVDSYSGQLVKQGTYVPSWQGAVR